EDTDLVVLERCVYLTCLVAPLVGDDSSDLDLLRLFANKCWIEGKAQKARDLAEEILLVATESPQRQRLAWASFGDIYHRMQMPIDALIGMACASARQT